MENKSYLFRPLEIRQLLLKNRIVMSPISLYSSDESGLPNYWHFQHWATRAVGGVSLIMSEATAVQPNGRLTPNDLCLFNDDQKNAFKAGIDLVHSLGANFGIQLGHCGRKAFGRQKGFSDHDLVAPSPVPFDNYWRKPKELTRDQIAAIIKAFEYSSRLAIDSGTDVVELHAAHGYLFHEFLSPISNRRTDNYGGSLKNRSRFLCQVINGVRKTVGEGIPIFVRISCTDWAEPKGFILNDAVKVSKMIVNAGADLIDCSSGGTLPVTTPPLKQGYQLTFSKEIKAKVDVIIGGVGLLTDPLFCDTAISRKKCDLIFLGRELLRNPYWPLAAAKRLNVANIIPQQYIRAY